MLLTDNCTKLKYEQIVGHFFLPYNHARKQNLFCHTCQGYDDDDDDDTVAHDCKQYNVDRKVNIPTITIEEKMFAAILGP